MSSKKNSCLPYVYVRSKEHAWVPGRLLRSDKKLATVVLQKYNDEQDMLLNTPKTAGVTVETVDVALKDYEKGLLPLQNVDDRGKLADHEDMVNLPYLHEVCRYPLSPNISFCIPSPVPYCNTSGRYPL